MMAEPQTGQPWTDTEVNIAVDIYLSMLKRQESGESFVKAEYRRKCEEQLPARSGKSIEYKWCNISAVLDEMGEPWIDGYKPLPNYQKSLRRAVEHRLA